MLRERCQFHAQAVSQVVNLQATREALVRLGFQANPLPLWGWLSFTNSPPPLPLTLSHTLSSALPPCVQSLSPYFCLPALPSVTSRPLGSHAASVLDSVELLSALSPEERELLQAITERGYPLRTAIIALQKTGQQSPEQVRLKTQSQTFHRHEFDQFLEWKFLWPRWPSCSCVAGMPMSILVLCLILWSAQRYGHLAEAFIHSNMCFYMTSLTHRTEWYDDVAANWVRS